VQKYFGKFCKKLLTNHQVSDIIVSTKGTETQQNKLKRGKEK
jgi:hypothetical protein